MTTTTRPASFTRASTMVIAIAIALGSTEAPARADGESAPASRPALLERAQRARAAGDHPRALEDAHRAGALKMTASLRRFIAEEELALGRLASAYESAEMCTREASLEPPSPNHDSVLLGCRTLLHDVRPRIGIVVLEIASPRPAGLAVTVNGRAMEQAGSVAVGPGPVVIEARAAGFRPLRREGAAVAGGTLAVPIALEQDAHVDAAAPDATLAPPGIGETRTTRGPVGLIVMAVGAVAAGGGVGAWVIANGKYDDLKSRCQQQVACPGADEDRSSIETLSTVATAGIIGGAGLVGAGLVYYLLDTKRVPSARAAATERGVDVRWGVGSVTLEGRF